MAATSPFDLTGRVALVTGSTRGIGAAIAEALARAGAAVAVHGRKPESTAAARESLAAELSSDGVDARTEAVSFDVTDHERMLEQVRSLEARLGAIDILVNNAGIQFRSPVVDFPLDAWHNVLDTNLTSVLVLSQHVARGMLERGHGKIINICSIQNERVRGATAAYAAAKSALGALGKAMCADWAPHGLQINGLAPGFIATDLNTALIEDPVMNAWVLDRVPARRWGTPGDVAGTAVWLASGASDFVNGQVVFVDGGMTAVV
jgi:gluconate 5-dehydrogenase